MKKGARTFIVIIIVIILVGSAVGVIELRKPSAPVQVKETLTVEESEYPDSIDPAVTYTTPGWEIMNQVYQGLVAPNGTSVTTFVGVLASNWTMSSDGLNYTFYLRQNVTFSNGDPFNAYVMWFSIYRTMIMDLAPSWILGQNLFPGNGINFNITPSIINRLDYSSPTTSDLYYMEYPNQSVQVVNKYEIICHLGYGYRGNVSYNAFLMTLTTPMAAAVDPILIEKNGGVVAGTPNAWMESNAIGTGFYEIYSIIPGESITLQSYNSYWANKIPASEWNDAIQPPSIKYIVIEYKDVSSIISDLRSGYTQLALAPVEDYGTIHPISSYNVTIMPIQFGSSEGAFYVYMDPYAFTPFQNIDVRKAITYAINYVGIIKSVFNSLADQWIGPIPPGFQYYNESIQGLEYYSYNATLAAQFLASAGYRAILPNGTVLNKNGHIFPTVNFLFNTDSVTDTETAEIIEGELASVGISINLMPLTFSSYEAAVDSTTLNSTNYPMGLNYYTEDYSASIDYVSALACTPLVGTSGYWNSTVFNWSVNASTSFNSAAIIQNFTYITQSMYNQYVMAWLYVPEFMSITQKDVTGMIPNPAGSGVGYFMFYNTLHYT
jgi:peptide/nickel transport system substrate-binding protein